MVSAMTDTQPNGNLGRALEGKAVVVTGAASGLGRAYALNAAAAGAAVLINDVSPEVEQVVAEIRQAGGRAVANVGTVESWENAGAIIQGCLEAFGRVDGLINNAGIIYSCPPPEAEGHRLAKVVSVNLLGALYVGTQALRVMAEQRSGSVVNMTSASQMGTPGVSAYAATKGALASLTYTWAIDMEPLGVRVNAFAPSAWTQMSVDAGKSPSIPTPPPEANAPAVTYLLSDHADGITGQVLQLRGHDIVVVQHPSLSEHYATNEHWTVEAVAQHVDPILREHLQPVGARTR
jgi:NAD(P)-dependent dehydrogenase (short-subunit alcohol dehydrogenase family)